MRHHLQNPPLDATVIVIAAQQGDTRAFETLMARFHDRALAVALSQLGNYHQAQDAVQGGLRRGVPAARTNLQTPPPSPAFGFLAGLSLGNASA